MGKIILQEQYSGRIDKMPPLLLLYSWSVCLSVRWSRLWALQKRLNRSKCRVGYGLIIKTGSYTLVCPDFPWSIFSTSFAIGQQAGFCLGKFTTAQNSSLSLPFPSFSFLFLSPPPFLCPLLVYSPPFPFHFFSLAIFPSPFPIHPFPSFLPFPPFSSSFSLPKIQPGGPEERC